MREEDFWEKNTNKGEKQCSGSKGEEEGERGEEEGVKRKALSGKLGVEQMCF